MKNKYLTNFYKHGKYYFQFHSLIEISFMTSEIIYGEILFIGMLFFPITMQYNVVHPGPCLEYGSRFCEEKVPNSFCLKKKNKCYCKPQYVDLKESFGIACKPRKSTFILQLLICTDSYIYTIVYMIFMIFLMMS